jgi:ligand-binding sensor domain-containing protein
MFKKNLLLLFILPTLLFTSCQKELSVSPEDRLIENIKLIVDSNPQGAKIFLNNLNTGQVTPDTLEWVEPGDHQLKLKLRLFKDTTVIVKIGEKEIDSVFLDYTTNPSMLGRISVGSKPSGAEIILDGIPTSYTTPKTITGLVPGQHKITLKLPGYWDAYVEETVVTGNTTYIEKSLIDTLVWINYTQENSNLPTNYFNVVEIQKGYIQWFGSELDGVVRYENNEFVVFNKENSPLPDDKINDIKAKNEDVWIATDYGLAHYNNGNWRIFDISNSPLPTNRIECIFIDHLNRTWIGTFNKGVFVFDGGGWTSYTASNAPLPSEMIKSIFVEQNGNFWIGTFGSGLVQFDGTDWRITTVSIPKSRIIEDIYVDDFSNVWIACGMVGIDSGGVAARIDNVWNNFYAGAPAKPLSGINVKDISLDQQNNLWFASYEYGLVKYNGTWKILTPQNSKLFSNRINSVAVDGMGNKWMTTFASGIIKYKGD